MGGLRVGGLMGGLGVGDRLLGLQPLQERGWNVDYSNKSVHTDILFSTVRHTAQLYLPPAGVVGDPSAITQSKILDFPVNGDMQVKDLGQNSALHATIHVDVHVFESVWKWHSI